MEIGGERDGDRKEEDAIEIEEEVIEIVGNNRDGKRKKER